MNEAGYTLAETLTALAMIGLAMGGVALGMQVIGRVQFSASQAVVAGQAVRSAQLRLEDLFLRGGPYRAHETDRFVGAAQRIAFDCGGAEPCKAELEPARRGFKLRIKDHTGRTLEAPLAGASEPHFVYEGRAGVSLTWPPSAGGREALRTVSLISQSDDGEVALLAARLIAEQPRRCDYDPILADCR